MTERKNIKVSAATRERLAGFKRDDETWDDLLERCAELLAVARQADA